MKREFCCRLTRSRFGEGEHRVIAVPTTLYFEIEKFTYLKLT